MSIEYLTAVWKDDYYTEKDKTKLLVALAIADCADGNGYAFPGVEYIAKKSRSTARFVQIVCRELQQDGKLKIQAGKGRNGTNLYQLVGVKPDHHMKKAVSDKGVKPVQGEASSGRNGVTAELTLELTAEVTPQITQTVSNHQEPSVTVRKKKDNSDQRSIPMPPELDTPAFRESWITFCQHRHEIGKPFTKTAAGLAVKKLTQWGVTRAIAALNHSAENGWSGIFQPTNNGKQAPSPKPKTKPLDPEGWTEWLTSKNYPLGEYATARGYLKDEFNADKNR